VVLATNHAKLEFVVGVISPVRPRPVVDTWAGVRPKNPRQEFLVKECKPKVVALEGFKPLKAVNSPEFVAKADSSKGVKTPKAVNSLVFVAQGILAGMLRAPIAVLGLGIRQRLIQSAPLV